MSAISKFTATRVKNFFSTAFKRINGVSQFATLDDLNGLVDTVNTIAANQSYSFTTHGRLTQSLSDHSVTVSAMTGGGNIACLDNCLHTSQGLKEQFCCGANYTYGINGKGAITDMVVTRTDVGTFTITIPDNRVDSSRVMSSSYLDTVVIIGNLASPGFATLTKTDNLHYTLVTISAGTGAAADGLLDGTAIQFTGYLAAGAWASPTTA